MEKPRNVVYAIDFMVCNDKCHTPIYGRISYLC